MAQRGADPEQLRSLARTFDSEASAIDQARQLTNALLAQTWWEGLDAQRFDNEWHGAYSGELRNVAQTLRNAAGVLRQAAVNQEVISRS